MDGVEESFLDIFHDSLAQGSSGVAEGGHEGFYSRVVMWDEFTDANVANTTEVSGDAVNHVRGPRPGQELAGRWAIVTGCRMGAAR